MTSADILTVAEAALELRCSKAHLCKVINGKVANVTPLPVIAVGGRKLIRRATLQSWIAANERALSGAMMASSQDLTPWTHERALTSCENGFRKAVYLNGLVHGSLNGGRTDTGGSVRSGGCRQ